MNEGQSQSPRLELVILHMVEVSRPTLLSTIVVDVGAEEKGSGGGTPSIREGHGVLPNGNAHGRGPGGIRVGGKGQQLEDGIDLVVELLNRSCRIFQKMVFGKLEKVRKQLEETVELEENPF